MSSNDKFERDFEAWLQAGDADLSALYRKLPQAEPDAKLDAAVLAMAHRALNPELVATPIVRRATAARRHARWLPALSAAATAVFAIGVAVKFAPHLWTQRLDAPVGAGARDEGVVHVRPIDAPVSAPEPPVSPAPPQAQAANGELARHRLESPKAAAKQAPISASPPAPPERAAPAPLAEEERSAQLKKSEKAAAASEPRPFPAQKQTTRQVEMDAVERKEAIAEGAWQRLHETESAPVAPAAAAASAGFDKDRASGSIAPLAAQPAAPAQRAAAPAPVPVPATAAAAAPPAAVATVQQAAAPARPADAYGLPAAAGGFAAPQAPAATADSQKSDDQKNQALDPVAVTGSNIRRVDIETASPVVSIDREQAEKTQVKKLQVEKAPVEKAGRSNAEIKPGYAPQVIRNSHLYPESWVAAIQRLIRDGKQDEARQNIELFRQKYPKYQLPADVEHFAPQQ